MAFDSKRFFRDVDQRRQDVGLSWRQLGRELEVSASTFSRMAQEKRPDVDTFLKVLHWLGAPAGNYVIDADGVAMHRDPDTLDKVNAVLRSDAALDAEAADALEDIVRVAYRRFTQSN